MQSVEIIYLEDEEKDASDLKEKFKILSGFDNFNVYLVPDVLQLKEVLSREGKPPRVVIIDWLIGEKSVGPLALKLVRKSAGHPTSIVFTHFDNDSAIRSQALREGADFFVGKRTGVWGELYDLVIQGKILSIIREMGLDPEIAGVQTFVSELDQKLSFLGELVLRKWDSPNDVDRRLAWELMRGLEQWPVWNSTRVDTGQFGDLAFTSQLRVLIEQSGISPVEYLGWLDASEVIDVLQSDSEYEGISSNRREFQCLFKILWWTMRRSRYSPFLFKSLLETSGGYAWSSARPPWDEVGLRAYTSQGAVQLQSAAEWIDMNK